ncbi:hypothetical protein J6590_054961 [Homalodisca vitripennis]|nr:hypothetical protein J6590_054961 [Homalodisca vitripennis]
MGDIEVPVPRPKKRLRQPDKHNRAEAKKNRNSGKAYVNRKNNNVDPKIFRDIDCDCQRECYSKVDVEERRNLHKKFWDIGDVYGLVQCSGIDSYRPRTKERSARPLVNLFFLNKSSNFIQVCKRFYLDTFYISDGRVTRASPRAIPVADTAFVKQHRKFPRARISLHKDS